MAEFMEHGGHIIKRNERRLARCRFGEIANIIDHGFGAHQFRLPYEIIHPGAARFIIAFVIIAVKQAPVIFRLCQTLQTLLRPDDKPGCRAAL
jgi:hypothetical protein